MKIFYTRHIMFTKLCIRIQHVLEKCIHNYVWFQITGSENIPKGMWKILERMCYDGPAFGHGHGK